MDRIGNWLSDDRLLTNLIGLHIVLGAILFVSVVLRKIVTRGGSQMARWTGLHWLDGISKEAVRHVRALLFRATVGLMALAVIGGVTYHLAGRNIRLDVHAWYTQLTAREIFDFGVILGELVLLGVGLYFALRLVRRVNGPLEKYALSLLPHSGPLELERLDASGAAITEQQRREQHEHTVKHWFHLLQRFAVCSVVLTAIWIGGHIVHLSGPVDRVIGFSIRMLAIVMVARLLILACRTISHALASLGNRHLGQSKFTRYWERVTRLFPFGEKCFEAAVYVSAASLCVRELAFIAVVADFGPRIVQCIGIFFVTRVVIELSTVLLNEAFGMYAEDRPVDQKGQTLVPLLQSICQYVLYFGCGIMMMGVMGIPTQPILAGAGILGLAGGLGAQSLVTDVVSGFFILFENQYLVGDVVQICDAQGRVEAVSIRHTQVRDEQGRLYIIPNGQIKSVINFSKGFVNAIVDIKVPTSTPVDQIMRDMAEAGQRLRQKRREVLADTVVKGLVELTPSDMTIRAVTRVQPGTHVAMQNEFRRLLKEVFDEHQAKAVGLAA
jgi:small-conductance mechanosensitive channel